MPLYKFLIVAKDMNDALNHLVQAVEEYIETGCIYIEVEIDLNN